MLYKYTAPIITDAQPTFRQPQLRRLRRQKAGDGLAIATSHFSIKATIEIFYRASFSPLTFSFSMAIACTSHFYFTSKSAQARHAFQAPRARAQEPAIINIFAAS